MKMKTYNDIKTFMYKKTLERKGKKACKFKTLCMNYRSEKE